jgi:hypothetical protein
MLVISPNQTHAVFIISGWEYDDGYGQGIEVVYIHENSTGSWVRIKDPAFFLPNDNTTIKLNATPNTALRVWPSANINHSLHGLTVNTSALAIMRVGLEVSVGGRIVYSLENMTWDAGTIYNDTETTWAVSYVQIIPIILVMGTIYTVRFDFEIYCLGD